MLTVIEAARRLSVHPCTVRGYIRTGALPIVKIGVRGHRDILNRDRRAVRIREEDLSAVIEFSGVRTN